MGQELCWQVRSHGSEMRESSGKVCKENRTGQRGKTGRPSVYEQCYEGFAQEGNLVFYRDADSTQTLGLALPGVQPHTHFITANGVEGIGTPP